jgi:acetolactate synthase-1/2/3 large subunit
MHLGLPQDVLEAAASAEPGPTLKVVAPSPKPFPDELWRAERPLIIAGPAMMRQPGLRALEEASGVPVIGMESPRGVNDPALGKLAQVLASADAVMLLGKRPDFTLRFGRAFAEGCRVMQADALPSAPERKRSGSWLDEVRAALAYRPPEWKSIATSLHPVAVCREVQAILKDGVLVCDGGEFGQWAQACLDAPSRVINGVAGSIGSGLPYALGARCAQPDAPVVAVMGDGTVGFHIAEFDTAVRYRLPFVAVVGNDARWNAEYQIQLREYGPGRLLGCELLPTRYDLVAQAFGAHGEQVSDAAAMTAAAGRAQASGMPACINVMIEGVAAPQITR